MKLMIVDDEKSVVDTLALAIPWEEVGIRQVFRAYSGAEAWSIIDKQVVDIVITDIQMPVISGIELIRELRRRKHRTKCILLSGFAEFEYAQEAIRNETHAYLLKPVRYEELLEIVRSLVQELIAEWEAIASSERAIQALRNNVPMLRWELLRNILTSSIQDISALQDELRLYGIPFKPGDDCVALIIRLDEGFRGYGSLHDSVLEFSIGNIAEENFQNNFHIWQTKDDYGFIVFLAKVRREKTGAFPEGCDKIFESAAEHMQNHITTYLKGKVTVIISPWGRFPEQLPSMYRSCITTLQKQVGSGSDFFLSAQKEETQEIHAFKTLHEPPYVFRLLEVGDWAEVDKRISAIFAELSQYPDSAEHVMEVYSMFFGAFAFLAHRNGKLLFDLLGDPYKSGNQPFMSAEQLRKWVLYAVQKLKEENAREIKGRWSDIVVQVQAYIRKNLSEDISLQSLSEQVFLHPVYLSKIYKTETGEGLSDYILRIKMEHAARLLLSDRDCKVYEVAEKTGFQNPSYFIKVFRNQFGMTPLEYRKAYSPLA